MALGFPPLYPRTQAQWLALLKRHAARTGLCFEDSEGLAETLFTLYSSMLCDTSQRLSQTPEKHRYLFLNSTQIPRRPARSGGTVAVFEVAEGHDAPVAIRENMLLMAENTNEGTPGAPQGPILFRVKGDFEAYACRLTDIVWTDAETDTAACISPTRHASGVPATFLPWDKTIPPAPGRRYLELVFENVLCSAGGEFKATFSAELLIDGTPCPLARLADPALFRWTMYAEPNTTGSGDIAETDSAAAHDAVPLSLRVLSETSLLLTTQEFCCVQPQVCVRITVIGAKCPAFELRGCYAETKRSGIAPDCILSDSRQLDAAGFYPFGRPLRSCEACAVFCDSALFHPGAEITLSYTLKLEETEEQLPKLQEMIDYRWIMRKPLPQPAQETVKAYAQQVLWEYWNGAAFCALPIREAVSERLDAPKECMTLRFCCPHDIAPYEYGGKTGYFLRFSNGVTDTLYHLPRRVYTPYLENLRFSYCSVTQQRPVSARAYYFGEIAALKLSEPLRPFPPLPHAGQALFLGFDSLPADRELRLFFCLDGCALPRSPLLGYVVGNGENADGRPLILADETCGLAQSGIVRCLTPKAPAAAALFGRSRYWICMAPPKSAPGTALAVAGIYPNAQHVENRVRHVQQLTPEQMPADGVLALAYQNIVKLWCFVHTPSAPGGEMKKTLWRRYLPSQGDFRAGFYKIDFTRGILTLPRELCAAGQAAQEDPLVEVIYDTCNGKFGNVPAGAISAMQEAQPFLTAIYNPLPVMTGGEAESDERLAMRIEHLLHCGGHAVSPRDFELLAADYCPLVHRAKCVLGETSLQVAVLPRDAAAQVAFPEIRAELAALFQRIGCADTFGLPVDLFPVRTVMLFCRFSVRGSRRILSELLLPLREALTAFVDPVTGGPDKQGFAIGTLPAFEQIFAQAALLLRQAQNTLALVQESFIYGILVDGTEKPIAACGRIPQTEDPFCVPGGIKITAEAKMHDEAAPL